MVFPVLGLVLGFPFCLGAGAGAVSAAVGGGEAAGVDTGGAEAVGLATGAETGVVEVAGEVAGATGAGGLATGAAAGVTAGAFEGGALLGAFAGEDLLGAFAGEDLLGGGAVVGAATGALEVGDGAVEFEGLGLAAGAVELVEAGVGAVANIMPTSPSTVFISAVAMHNHNTIHKYAIFLSSEAIGSTWCCRNTAKAETLMLFCCFRVIELLSPVARTGKTSNENA